MTINYLSHDVTATTRGVVAHGCNCQGVMGSGVALAIRKKWPLAFERYHLFVDQHRKNHHYDMSGLLGLAQVINVGDPFIDEPNSLFVSNIFSQERYGKDGKIYARPEAVAQGLDTTFQFCEGAHLPLYMPRIGCGLGGLNWTRDVLIVLEELTAKYDVKVYVCDL